MANTRFFSAFLHFFVRKGLYVFYATANGLPADCDERGIRGRFQPNLHVAMHRVHVFLPLFLQGSAHFRYAQVCLCPM